MTHLRNPVTAPHSITGRWGVVLQRRREKNWWTKGWQSHYYLLFLLAQTNDSLVLIETLLSVALVFLQQRKKKTKTACSPWINLSDETNSSIHTIQPLKVIKVNKKYNWCHPGVENRILTSSRVKSSFTINVAFKSCRGIMNKFNY